MLFFFVCCCLGCDGLLILILILLLFLFVVVVVILLSFSFCCGCGSGGHFILLFLLFDLFSLLSYYVLSLSNFGERFSHPYFFSLYSLLTILILTFLSVFVLESVKTRRWWQ